MLSVAGVTRRFGDLVALDDVSFEVRPGRLTGFVGANGAGKTTAMRIILGVLAPSAGQVNWDGAPLTQQQRSMFGYMPEERGLYPKMKVADQLEYFGRLRGLSKSQAHQRTADLLGRLSLDKRADDLLDSLSLGNQQRAQIAAALVHHPIALVLDEPFSGLDPLAVDAMVDLMREEVTPQMPVLFSSHQLDLVERLCDDLVILSRGRVVAAGSVEQLRGSATAQYRIETGSDLAWLSAAPGVTDVRIEGQRATFTASDPGLADQVLRTGLDHGTVIDFGPVRVSLSELFREAVAK